MRLREAAPLLVDVGTADSDVSKAPLDNDWRKVTVAQIVVAREEEVARAFGINDPGG